MNEPLTISDEAREAALDLYKLLGNNVINRIPSYVRDLEPIIQLAINAAVEKVNKQNERLLSLVRLCRAELHQQDAITDDEYATLAGKHELKAVLETHDDLRQQLTALRKVTDGLALAVEQRVVPTGPCMFRYTQEHQAALTAYTNFINQQKEGK